MLSIAGMSNGISCTAHALFMRTTNPVHTDTIRKRTWFICFIEKSKAISLISIFVSHQKKRLEYRPNKAIVMIFAAQ